MKTAEPLKVGVIGAGKHGSRYARHLGHDVAELELTAICRRSAAGRELAEELGCRWYPEWRQLVEVADVDCVIAAVPPVLNLEIATACARARKPLLLEKPMAVSAAEAGQICTLFAQASLPLTIGQTLRYNQVILTLRGQARQLGRLLGFSANQRLEPSPLAWLDEPRQAGAGVSFHTAVHVFDALRFITGREIVRVMAYTRRIHTTQLEDSLLALIELDNGVTGVVDCSKISPARSGRFEFVGEAGLLQADQIHHSCSWVTGTQQTPVPLEAPVNTIVPLLKDWAAFLRGEAPNPVPGEEGLAAVRICEACVRSAAAGEWVEIEKNPAHWQVPYRPGKSGAGFD